jgi:hypothetical protein
MRVAHRPKSRYPSRLVRLEVTGHPKPRHLMGAVYSVAAPLTLHQFLPNPCWRPHANLYITTSQPIHSPRCPSLYSVLKVLSPPLPNTENLRVAPGGFSISGYFCHENRLSLTGPKRTAIWSPLETHQLASTICLVSRPHLPRGRHRISPSVSSDRAALCLI